MVQISPKLLHGVAPSRLHFANFVAFRSEIPKYGPINVKVGTTEPNFMILCQMCHPCKAKILKIGT